MTKKWKSLKSQKRENAENPKSEKVIKWKNQNMTKKVSKNEVPQKRAKCHLNGQNRHFAKSEPPGPAFFQSLGVPRDPILRPKMTWGGQTENFDHIFWVFTFSFSHFCHFLYFSVLSLFHFFSISWFCTFFDFHDFWSIFVVDIIFDHFLCLN